MRDDRWAAVPEEPRPPLLDIATLVILYGVGFVVAGGVMVGVILTVAALI